MRITESRLRRIIREELLREAAMTPGDAAKNGITFEVQSFANSVEISAFKDGNSIATLEAEYSRACDAWPVSKAFSDVDGLGPLLYDLLIDIVHPEPITSDRELVTPAARAVWEYYTSRRPDIETVDLPEKCPQDSAERHLGDDLWRESPLSKGYKRRDGSDYLVLGALRKMGIIEGYD